MDTGAGGAGEARPYVLGHSDREIDRLMAQARLIDPITERFFREAGVEPGMRVLDVGSGAGDVAFVAARIVGSEGEVVGVDRVAAALDTARSRAAGLSLHNVTFLVGDPVEIAFERPFDAVLGRYVLQFQADPAAMLRKLSTKLRPGGLIVFHEIDWAGIASYPAAPIYEQCRTWAVETLRLHGTEPHMGTKLFQTFTSAGLAAPTMRLESLVGAGQNSLDRLFLLAEIVRTLLPEMERLGVASAADVGIDTLVERMHAEATANRSLVVGHYQVAAWSRIGL